jgi:excisionase family DNA binding protein
VTTVDRAGPASDNPGPKAGVIVVSPPSVSKGETHRMLRDPLIPRLVSVTEAAEILGLTGTRVHQLIKEGKIPAGRAGSTLVLTEETVRRYAAGERFSAPSELVISAYDDDVDRWEVVGRRPVIPDYEMPQTLTVADIGGSGGQTYRVELVDTRGKVMGMVTVDGNG